MDVIHRILHDGSLKNKDEFYFGYLDRFLGVIERRVTSATWSDIAVLDLKHTMAVPKHRIMFIRYGTIKIWDREKRVDYMFQSGCPVSCEKNIYEIMESEDGNNPNGCQRLAVRQDAVAYCTEKKREKRTTTTPEGPTHIFCIQVVEKHAVEHALACQRALVKVDSRLRPACIALSALRVTLAAVQCLSQDDIQRAVDVLESDEMKDVWNDSVPAGWSLAFDGTGHFQQGRVLYKAVAEKYHAVLQRFIVRESGLKACICSADDFFVDSKTREYNFNAEKLAEAHRACANTFMDALRDHSVELIILDNTNCEVWNYRLYALKALQYGYTVNIVEVNGGKDTAITDRNIHGVARTAIESMRRRWEEDQETPPASIFRVSDEELLARDAPSTMKKPKAMVLGAAVLLSPEAQQRTLEHFLPKHSVKGIDNYHVTLAHRPRREDVEEHILPILGGMRSILPNLLVWNERVDAIRVHLQPPTWASDGQTLHVTLSTTRGTPRRFGHHIVSRPEVGDCLPCESSKTSVVLDGIIALLVKDASGTAQYITSAKELCNVELIYSDRRQARKPAAGEEAPAMLAPTPCAAQIERLSIFDFDQTVIMTPDFSDFTELHGGAMPPVERSAWPRHRCSLSGDILALTRQGPAFDAFLRCLQRANPSLEKLCIVTGRPQSMEKWVRECIAMYIPKDKAARLEIHCIPDEFDGPTAVFKGRCVEMLAESCPMAAIEFWDDNAANIARIHELFPRRATLHHCG
eukprot:g2767.t1